MKKAVVTFLLVFCFIPNVFAGNIIKDITSVFEKIDLDIKYVGKITLGEPYTVSSSFFGVYTHIPFSTEGGEWHGNSAMGFHGTESNVEGSVINFTSRIVFMPAKNVKKEIVLRNIASGSYIVNYKNPDGSIVYVGTVEL